jgi:hypothetical protein
MDWSIAQLLAVSIRCGLWCLSSYNLLFHIVYHLWTSWIFICYHRIVVLLLKVIMFRLTYLDAAACSLIMLCMHWLWDDWLFISCCMPCLLFIVWLAEPVLCFQNWCIIMTKFHWINWVSLAILVEYIG